MRVDQLSAWSEVASESFQERWFEARVRLAKVNDDDDDGDDDDDDDVSNYY